MTSFTGKHQSEPSPDPREVLSTIEGQAAWAMSRGFELSSNGKGFRDPASGLFQEMHAETRTELERGAGGELSRIHSLRSSTCLAVNVFEPWRISPRPIGELFGVRVDTLQFEAKQPTGLSGEPPHLDVLLTGSGPSIGVEAKFLELYSPATNAFKPSYFPTHDLDSPLWDGLASCRHLAERIARREEVFTWLTVGQLLKHALGLAKNQPDGFRLALVWYRIDGPTADSIEEEIGRFTRAVSTDLDFTALTYQELMSRLISTSHEPVSGYFEYLVDRYRLSSEENRQLPLVALAQAPAVNHKSGLAVTISEIDLGELTSAYCQTSARAPQRRLARLDYLVDGHDGLGGTADRSREKKAAKALFNMHRPLLIGGESVSLLDYEVPLRARKSDRKVGEIDLLGLGSRSGRPWVIELKVSPNRETPLKALYQALRYSAILDANRRQVNGEVFYRAGLPALTWPGVIAVAADRGYWQHWLGSSRAGEWLPALRGLGSQIARELGIEVVLIDLGTIEGVVVDGAPQLTADPEIRLL